MKPTVVGHGGCAFARFGGMLVLLTALVGCGDSGTGTVSGRVLVGKAKEPLPGGNITFAPVDAKHRPITTDIDENGNYTVTVPVGEARISVDNRHLMPSSADAPPGLPPDMLRMLKVKGPPPKGPEAPAQTGKYRKIPDRYSRTEQSKLKYTVTSGSQKHDVELEER
jgi:hypothetical protein